MGQGAQLAWSLNVRRRVSGRAAKSLNETSSTALTRSEKRSDTSCVAWRWRNGSSSGADQAVVTCNDVSDGSVCAASSVETSPMEGESRSSLKASTSMVACERHSTALSWARLASTMVSSRSGGRARLAST